MSNPQNNSNRGASWALILTAIICFAPVVYVVASGPMKIVFDNLGATGEAHDRAFAPLVWLRDNTPAAGVIDRYWGLFPDWNKKVNRNLGVCVDEYDAVAKEARGNTEIDTDPLGEWLYSPEARAINRHLGVSD